jgi:PKD repeat protein
MRQHFIVSALFVFIVAQLSIIPVSADDYMFINDTLPFESPFGSISIDAIVVGSSESLPLYHGKFVENGSMDIQFEQFGKKRTNVTSREEAPMIAKKIMESYGGLPDDAVLYGVSTSYSEEFNHDTNTIVSKEPVFTTVTYSKDMNGLWIVGDVNSVILTLGDDGKLLWLLKVWRNYTYTTDASIIPVTTALEKLKQGDVINGPMIVDEKISIDSASPGYYANTLPNDDTTLEPVWMLFGDTSNGSRVGFYIYARQFANFTLFPSAEVTRYEPVSFIDTSETTVTRWYWDFGDGTNSTEQYPSHLYRTGGNYTVNLSVWNDMGSDMISRQDYVHVFYHDPAPVAMFSTNYTTGYLCDVTPISNVSPAVVEFSDQSLLFGNNTGWFWDFGDGTNSTEQNPIHTFSFVEPEIPGYYNIYKTTYPVKLTVTDKYGRVSTYFEYLHVYRPVLIDFTAEPASGTYPLAVTFTELPSGMPAWMDYHRSWDFGDGTGNESFDGYDEKNDSVIPRPKSVTHIYTSPGNYTVTLTTGDGDCQGRYDKTKESYIYVGEYDDQLIPDFTANVTYGRTPLTVGFTDSSIGSPKSWNWSFGDETWSVEKNPAHVFPLPGKYTVALSLSDSYEENITTKIDYISVYDPVSPSAGFSANVTSGYEPLAVSFTDTSENGPEQWNWSFGDGTYSTGQHPVHEYLYPGIYSVSLVVTSEFGADTMTQPDYITVIGAYPTETISVPPPVPPYADFIGIPVSGKEPLTVQFNDLSANYPDSWYWDFGDGTNATEKDPGHIYISEGSFTVSLTVTNEEGSNTTVKTDYITVVTNIPPSTDFSANSTSGNAPLAVRFIDRSTGLPDTWSWSFGDGATSDEQNPEHTYTGTGTYTVSLESTNAGGSNTTTKVDYITVVTNSPPPVADFTGKPACGKAPLSVKFTDTSTGNPITWFWDFGDGTNATDQNPVHTYTSGGKFTVSLTAANAGGSDTKSRTEYISVSGTVRPPVANFYGKPTTGKAPLSVKFTDASTGGPASWLWDFGDGSNATDRNPVHSYAVPGKYTVLLTVRNSAGSNTKTRDDYITVKGLQPPFANFYGKPTSGQAPLSVKFTDASTGNPTAWLWDFGDDSTSAEKNPDHRYVSAGKYTVSLTASNAAGSTTKTRTQYITVNGVTPTPTPSHTCTPKPTPTHTCTPRPTTICTTKPTTTSTTSPCEPHEIPQVTGRAGNGMIRLDWNVITNPCLQGYKVVVSKNNPTPEYPDDGYVFWLTNRNRNYSVIHLSDHYNGGDFGGYLQPGRSYYFSITAVYSDAKVAGNAVRLEYPEN